MDGSIEYNKGAQIIITFFFIIGICLLSGGIYQFISSIKDKIKNRKKDAFVSSLDAATKKKSLEILNGLKGLEGGLKAEAEEGGVSKATNSHLYAIFDSIDSMLKQADEKKDSDINWRSFYTRAYVFPKLVSQIRNRIYTEKIYAKRKLV